MNERRPEEQPTRVLLVRHGETDWNRDARIQGHTDIPLNATGRWQAERVAEAVRDDGLHAIYSSDLLRAAQTADAIADATGLTVRHERGLRERSFGAFEGHRFVDIEQSHPGEASRWKRRDPTFEPPGGESLNGLSGRVVETAVRLSRHHAGQSIALVSHGGVLDILYREATRIDLQAPRSWLLANASVNRLLHSEEGFVLLLWGDTSHLDERSCDEFGPVA
jgi:2,3-bisphosphoglycerate-dependent phosphoglycerate mutase